MSTGAPSNDDLTAGVAVAGAGKDAAEAAATPDAARPAAKRAMRAKAKEVNMSLSDEDVDRLANALVDKMDERGAFEEPPEPVTAPPAAAAGGAPAGAPVTEPTPVKQTWAERRFRTS
jgi:hypothetical protein